MTSASTPAPALHLRIDRGSKRAFGPGKARLLEAIAETGSISAAGRALGMSYRRAWLLVADLNAGFRSPLVEAQTGGGGGGGAQLTNAGERVLKLYRAMQAKSAKAVRTDLSALAAMFAPPGKRPKAP
jgi:molybdate transport system regulatory protein